MKNTLNFIIIFLLVLCAFSCSERSAGNKTMQESSMEIEILPGSGVLVEEVKGILQARGKTDGDIWHIDRLERDIRITKSRSDGIKYPPGDETELWYYDSTDKIWKKRIKWIPSVSKMPNKTLNGPCVLPFSDCTDNSTFPGQDSRPVGTSCVTRMLARKARIGSHNFQWPTRA